jgi:hypothetical protein
MKYITILTLIKLALTFHLLPAQAPDTIWTKTFGGSGWDEGRYVQQTNDRGYIIVGSTFSYGMDAVDVWLIKTDESGDTLWTKTINGGDDDYGNSVQQTTDGGYIITGRTSANIPPDVWLIKTDVSGDTLWTKTFDGNGADWGNSVYQTLDGGYVITGLTGNIGQGTGDIWLIKTDASGDSIWTKTFGGGNEDEGNAVQQTADGGYIITGYTNGAWWLQREAFLLKTSASGDTLWTKKFRSSSKELNFWDYGSSVQQSNDGGYILTGSGRPAEDHNELDGWLIKTDASGDTLWTKSFGQTRWEGRSVKQTSDGGYIIAGSINIYGNDDVLLIKTDEMGDTLWTKILADTGDSRGHSVQETKDGGYIIIGNKSDDLWLIKTEADPSGFRISNNRILSTEYVLFQNYPNPFNPMTTIEFNLPKTSEVILKVFNILGEEIAKLHSGYLFAGLYKYEWSPPAGMASGVYLYRLQVGDYVETRKMVLMR